jgi:hypothetical protein
MSRKHPHVVSGIRRQRGGRDDESAACRAFIGHKRTLLGLGLASSK